MIHRVRTLALFVLANLLSLAISTTMAALCSLPFAFLGGYLGNQWLEHPLSTQTDISMSIQGAGIFMGAISAFIAALLVALIFIFPRVSRVVERKFFF